MGKGMIVAGGTDGKYNVSVKYNTDLLTKLINGLNQLITECNSMIAALEAELAQVNIELIELEQEAGYITTQLNILISEIAEAYHDKEALENENINLQKDIDNAERAINVLEVTLSFIEDNISTLQSQIQDIETEINSYTPPYTPEEQTIIDNLEAQKIILEADLVQAQASLANTQTAINNYQYEIDTKTDTLEQNETEIEQLNNDISTKDAQIKQYETEIDEKQLNMQDAEIRYRAIQGSINATKAHKLSYDKQKDRYNSVPKKKDITVWCVDFSEEMAGEVGLIEVPGEDTHYNLQPGYKKQNPIYDPIRDGQEVPILAQTPAQFFYNYAMLPAWQKWMPTYRYGMITTIDYNTDTATVDLEDIRSSQQDIEINVSNKLFDVPIEYMYCNSQPFLVNDMVVVKFEGLKVDNPKIIGYAKEPKRCQWIEQWDGPLLVSKWNWEHSWEWSGGNQGQNYIPPDIATTSITGSQLTITVDAQPTGQFWLEQQQQWYYNPPDPIQENVKQVKFNVASASVPSNVNNGHEYMLGLIGKDSNNVDIYFRLYVVKNTYNPESLYIGIDGQPQIESNWNYYWGGWNKNILNSNNTFIDLPVQDVKITAVVVQMNIICGQYTAPETGEMIIDHIELKS